MTQPPLKLDFRVKDLFFDSPRVARAMKPARRKALSKAGAFIRRRARSLIRKRKRVSEPGSPPSSHSGEPNLRTIFFAYDPGSDSVVVGPVLLHGGRGSPTVPALLEFGGETRVRRRRRKPYTARYRPRPFMGPALELEVAAGTLADVFRESVEVRS